MRSTRNKALDSKNLKNISKYVKVGADGAPYLRKVDLEMYKCYEELLTALEKMFTSFTINGTAPNIYIQTAYCMKFQYALIVKARFNHGCYITYIMLNTCRQVHGG